MRPPRAAAARGPHRARVRLDDVAPLAITSPVERISGPRSARPAKRSVGKIASFAHARSARPAPAGRARRARAPSSSRHACSTSGHAGRLRDERHRPRRARVRLEHVELAPRASASWRLSSPRAPSAARDRRCRGADLRLERRRHRRRRARRRPSRPSGRRRARRARGSPPPRRLAVAERVDVELERALEEAVDEARPGDVELLGRCARRACRGRRARSAAGRAPGSRSARRPPAPPAASSPRPTRGARRPSSASSAPKRPRSSAASIAGERIAEQRHAGRGQPGREPRAASGRRTRRRRRAAAPARTTSSTRSSVTGSR